MYHFYKLKNILCINFLKKFISIHPIISLNSEHPAYCRSNYQVKVIKITQRPVAKVHPQKICCAKTSFPPSYFIGCKNSKTSNHHEKGLALRNHNSMENLKRLEI